MVRQPCLFSTIPSKSEVGPPPSQPRLPHCKIQLLPRLHSFFRILHSTVPPSFPLVLLRKTTSIHLTSSSPPCLPLSLVWLSWLCHPSSTLRNNSQHSHSASMAKKHPLSSPCRKCPPPRSTKPSLKPQSPKQQHSPNLSPHKPSSSPPPSTISAPSPKLSPAPTRWSPRRWITPMSLSQSP